MYQQTQKCYLCSTLASFRICMITFLKSSTISFTIYAQYYPNLKILRPQYHLLCNTLDASLQNIHLVGISVPKKTFLSRIKKERLGHQLWAYSLLVTIVRENTSRVSYTVQPFYSGEALLADTYIYLIPFGGINNTYTWSFPYDANLPIADTSL